MMMKRSVFVCAAFVLSTANLGCDEVVAFIEYLDTHHGGGDDTEIDTGWGFETDCCMDTAVDTEWGGETDSGQDMMTFRLFNPTDAPVYLQGWSLQMDCSFQEDFGEGECSFAKEGCMLDCEEVGEGSCCVCCDAMPPTMTVLNPGGSLGQIWDGLLRNFEYNRCEECGCVGTSEPIPGRYTASICYYHDWKCVKTPDTDECTGPTDEGYIFDAVPLGEPTCIEAELRVPTVQSAVDLVVDDPCAACGPKQICSKTFLMAGPVNSCIDLPDECVDNPTCDCLQGAACPIHPMYSCTDVEDGVSCSYPVVD